MNQARPLAILALAAILAAGAILLLPPRPNLDLPTAPLVFDLDGDGADLRQADRTQVYFDIDHDGYAERIGWPETDDGVLVIDRNGNGVVDDTAEFLGDDDWKLADLRGSPAAIKLASGFNRLRAWDDNDDGIVDASDAAFATILIWRDIDDDGSSESGELQTLPEVGVAFLSTNSTPGIVNDRANTITDIGEFGRLDGSKGTIISVRFGFDGTKTRFLGELTLDPATASLPKLDASGNAKDLSFAMSEDEQLRKLVSEFVALTIADAPDLESRVEQIMFRWYRTDGVDRSSRGPNIDGRWLATLERIRGDPWRSRTGSTDPDIGAAAKLAEAWRKHKSQIAARLLAQSPLGEALFPGLTYKAMKIVELPDTLELDAALANLRRHSPADADAKLRYWSSVILVLDELYWQFEEIAAQSDRSRFKQHFAGAIDAALAADGVTRSYLQLSGRDMTASNDD